MKLVIGAKKIDNKWEGALVADGRFQRAFVSDKLEDVILRGLVGVFTGVLPEGTNVVVDVMTETPSDQEVTGGAQRG